MEFVCSAIKIILKNNLQIIIYGKRHCDCLEQIYKLGIERDSSKDIHGFIILINNLETFADRYNSAIIAKRLGYKLEYENILFSEDIWPE